MGAGGCVGLCVTQGRIDSTNQMAGLKTKSPFFILLLVVFFFIQGVSSTCKPHLATGTSD